MTTRLDDLVALFKKKYCPRCHEHKLRSQFGASRSRPDGLQGFCKTCRAAETATPVRRQREQRSMLSAIERERIAIRQRAAFIGSTTPPKKYQGVRGGLLLAGYVS